MFQVRVFLKEKTQRQKLHLLKTRNPAGQWKSAPYIVLKVPFPSADGSLDTSLMPRGWCWPPGCVVPWRAAGPAPGCFLLHGKAGDGWQNQWIGASQFSCLTWFLVGRDRHLYRHRDESRNILSWAREEKWDGSLGSRWTHAALLNHSFVLRIWKQVCSGERGLCLEHHKLELQFWRNLLFCFVAFPFVAVLGFSLPYNKIPPLLELYQRSLHSYILSYSLYVGLCQI